MPNIELSRLNPVPCPNQQKTKRTCEPRYDTPWPCREPWPRVASRCCLARRLPDPRHRQISFDGSIPRQLVFLVGSVRMGLATRRGRAAPFHNPRVGRLKAYLVQCNYFSALRMYKPVASLSDPTLLEGPRANEEKQHA